MALENKKEDQKPALLLEDLSALKKYIRDLLAFSPFPICFVSSVGVILEINPALERFSKFKSHELIGESIEKVFDKEKIAELTKETLDKGFFEGEISFFQKGRKEVIVQVFTKARRDERGRVIGYFLSLFDLTKIKKIEREAREKTKELEKSQKALLNLLEETKEAKETTEKALKESEEKTRVLEESRIGLLNLLEDLSEAKELALEEKDKTLAVINNFADGLLVFDKEKKLALINPQAEDFFEVKAKEIIEKPILELTKFPNFEPLVNLLGEEIKGVFRKELPIKENFILEASTIPMMKNKEKLGTLVILHDVSREKMIERMKTEFVSLAAHQLRTPLSAIKWTLRMILDGDLGPITEDQKDFMEKTYKSNERMITLINDLLNVTRIEEGRFLYKPTFVSLENVTQFVISSYREEIKKRKIQFEFKKPKEKLPLVFLDVEKIQLAIQNLLDNAIRYTSAGGKVTVSLKRAKKNIEFSIKDTGVGIPKDQQQRVFSKFFRGANVIKMETEGSGLGLFITKNIIEAHGGRIWFESVEDKGSTFYFTLPIKEEKIYEFLKEF